MSQKLIDAIDEVKVQIHLKEQEILPLKIAVNQLCALAGIPQEYDVTSAGNQQSARRALAWRVDHFFNRPLASSIIEIMEVRKAAGLDGPTSVNELYAALVEGGFKFEGSSSEENNKRALRISLTKNTAQFVKVKDDVFGLKKWYGSRQRKAGGSPQRSGEQNDAADESDEFEQAPEPEEQTEMIAEDSESVSGNDESRNEG